MKYLALALGPLAFAFPAVARAATFADDGTFVFEPGATATLDFEGDVPKPDGTAGSLSVDDAGALHGARVLALDPFAGADLAVAVPATASTYRVSAWVRGTETVVDVEVRYADNPHPGVDEITMLYPTGRVTSDGWVELANEHVRIDGTRGAAVSVGFFSAAGSAVDAVEVVRDGDLGPGERSGAFCSGSADPVCGPSQSCLFNQCRWVGGQVPPIPDDRDQVADYLAARARLLFGPFENRRLDLPNADVAFERMRSATDPWTYWNGFMLGVRRLHDGHTTTSSIGDFVLENERPIGLCFIEGDADLSHALAPKDPDYLDVLVSHSAASRTLGMVPGDRLVAVDGVHPIAWARAQIEQHWSLSPTSNHATFAELSEQLRGLVARYARTITIVRCDQASGTCSAAEDLDLSAIPTIAPDEVFSSVQCDSRPLRHLASSPANHSTGGNVLFGIVNESDATERIYGAEFDSLYTSGTDGVGPGLKAAVAQFKADARGVVLDHRSGDGGTILAPQILWDFAVPRHAVTVYFDRQRAEDELPSITDGLLSFQKGETAGLADLGGSASATTMPVALLITRDVSASDWLPLGLKDQSPNVKIFGPFQTNGGFSTRYGFGYWLGMSYVMAVGDSFDPTGRTLNGRGVEPDVVVLPKQSDLLAGRDSVFEAAFTWVQTEAGAQ
jgi:hypothetical protein